MKCLSLCILFTLTIFQSPAQPLIHAHNDYQKPEPLTNALHYKVFSIEADIYLSGNRLLVAHDLPAMPSAGKPAGNQGKDIAMLPTLDSLYLQPIIKLFRQHGGTISADSNYTTTLMIDIKDNGEAVIAELIKLLAPHRSVFDFSANAKAVQVVISGDRGPITKWVSYPSFIFFDGRPNEVYDSATLQRVAFISENWWLLNIPADDNYTRLKQVVEKVHDTGKRIRFWASPDNPESWKKMQQLGIDIINTDKVEECRNYFFKAKR